MQEEKSRAAVLNLLFQDLKEKLKPGAMHHSVLAALYA